MNAKVKESLIDCAINKVNEPSRRMAAHKIDLIMGFLHDAGYYFDEESRQFVDEKGEYLIYQV